MWSRIMKVPSERLSSDGSKNEYTIDSPPAIFDNAGLDVAVLHHHRVIEHGHVGHAAMAMALVEIAAEHRILLRGRHGAALFADDVGIAGQNLPVIARGPE